MSVISPEERAALVALGQSYYEDVLNRHDPRAARRYLSPDYVDHSGPPGVPLDLDDTVRFLERLFAAFPDFTIVIDDQLAEGDELIIRWTAHGTHRGALAGHTPTHRRAELRGYGIHRVEDGRIVEHWGQFDQTGLAEQIGVRLTDLLDPGTRDT